MKLLLDCRTVSRLISQSQDRAPAPALQLRMRLHMATCRACRGVDDQMRFVRTAMRKLKMDPPEGRSAARRRDLA